MLKILRASTALVAVALFGITPSTFAAGLFQDSQGANELFLGLESTVFQYTIGVVPNGVRAGGTAAAGADTFENHISPVHIVGGDGDDFTYFAKVTSAPTWSVPMAQGFLRLDGAVKLQGPGSSIDITLKGEMGGDTLTTSFSASWTGEPVEFILNKPVSEMMRTGDLAVETLTIRVIGRARYDVDGSPEFLGGAAIPEPSCTLTLLALSPLVLRRARRTA